MNENSYPNNNYKLATPKVRSLFWQDRPDCAVLISSTDLSTDQATIIERSRQQVTLLLCRESRRGYVAVMVGRGTVPSDQALLAIGRTIMAHFAAVPEWRDTP